jgi:hypothetical protein
VHRDYQMSGLKGAAFGIESVEVDEDPGEA